MSSSRFVVILPILLLGTLGSACSKDAAATGASRTTPASPAPAPAMPAHATTAPAPPAATPLGEAGAPPAATSAAVPTATGTVLETMDAGGYTYVRLNTGTEKIWAATSPIQIKVGQELTVPLEMPMSNFHSQTLGRDFPLIYFASRVSRGGQPLPARAAAGGQSPSAGQTMPPGHPPVSAGQSPQPGQTPPAGQTLPPGHPSVGAAASAPIAVTEVIKPPAGGHSVADLWAKRATLTGKTVVVRGKVVKFLNGIMGRNWIHLQDGTGNAKDGTHDITVTTSDEAKPGDILTASGMLAIDKDFGAGYRYGAIVEGATLSK